MALAQGTRSLAPKEHGAYGQLAMPILSVALMGTPTRASVLLAIAAALLFSAHESALVMLGHRGKRAAEDDGRRARRILASSGLAALLLGGTGLALGPAAALPGALVALALGALVGGLVLARREKTTAGEFVATAAMTSAALPIGLAADMSTRLAVTVWLTWMLAFSGATGGVRSVIAAMKNQARAPAVTLLAVATLGVLGGALTGHATVIAATPMVLAGWGLAARPPHARHLRRVGWLLVGLSVVTLAWLVAYAPASGPAI